LFRTEESFKVSNTKLAAIARAMIAPGKSLPTMQEATPNDALGYHERAAFV
jgi:hypothetical protein